MIEHNA